MLLRASIWRSFGAVLVSASVLSSISGAAGQRRASKHGRSYTQQKHSITRQIVNSHDYDIVVNLYWAPKDKSPVFGVIGNSSPNQKPDGYGTVFIQAHRSVSRTFNIPKGREVDFTSYPKFFLSASPPFVTGSFSDSGKTIVSLGIEKLTRTFQNRTDEGFYITFNSPYIFGAGGGAPIDSPAYKYHLDAHQEITFVFPEAPAKRGITFTIGTVFSFQSVHHEWTRKFSQDGTTIIANKEGTPEDNTANSNASSGSSDIDRIDVP